MWCSEQGILPFLVAWEYVAIKVYDNPIRLTCLKKHRPGEEQLQEARQGPYKRQPYYRGVAGLAQARGTLLQSGGITHVNDVRGKRKRRR